MRVCADAEYRFLRAICERRGRASSSACRSFLRRVLSAPDACAPSEDDHLSGIPIARDLGRPRMGGAVRRSGPGDGTIAWSVRPNPPCITKSLPSRRSRGSHPRRSRTSVPEALHLHAVGPLAEMNARSSSLWHWSARAFVPPPPGYGGRAEYV